MPIQHGIKITEHTTGARPLVTAATAVIGLVAIGVGADANAFPLNAPVLITDVRSMISKAGESGTLVDSLKAIADCCSPQIVVVRVEAGANTDATEDNVIVGIDKLVSAPSVVGKTPKILGVPKYDNLGVTTALAVAAKKLRAMVYAQAAATTIVGATTYRSSFGDREVELIYPDFNQWQGEAVARALGLRALIDETKGWHHSLSNFVVPGATGISTPVSWNMQGVGTDAAALNDAPVTTIINHNGLRFWGNRTCSDEPEYAFEVAVRTNYVIQDTIDQGLLWAMDKPMTAQLIRDILDTINAKLRSFVAAGQLIGARAWYDPSLNNETDLAAGKVNIDYDFTPCAPLELLGINSRITTRYYADFGTQIAA